MRRGRKRASEGHSTHVLKSAEGVISEQTEGRGGRRDTHELESVKRATNEDMGGKRASEEHSRTGERISSDK